jgi:hypothetical protein
MDQSCHSNAPMEPRILSTEGLVMGIANDQFKGPHCIGVSDKSMPRVVLNNQGN